ncbi:MAG: glycoside hydrolase family 127 protein [Clostridia bacterium]|nr:glycoside hydrolase family 127 protein [Clostridia bacterium]
MSTTPVSFTDIDITGGYWAKKQQLNRETTIHSVYNRFADTGRIKAFEFTWKEGSDEERPHFFWDSDVAKWMESAAYIIMKNPDEKLSSQLEQLIDLIEKNQLEDGYFNIFHTIVEPENRFKNRDHHELYCLGHLIEAAVAYKMSTDSDRFINILDKYIDLVIKEFVTDKTAAFVTPGHEEIELALIKLYRITKNKKYLDLAMFFIDERGKHNEHDIEWCKINYNQSHLPVREQTEAFGHCVRACYLYSAMADAAKETGDQKLLEACRSLFDDIFYKKMYITGGIGSSNRGEAFTVPYDMPNDTAYNETCASIAFYMFANRMKDIELNSKYADAAELALYNGFISGLSLDGKSFFYENPLEINLVDRTRHTSVNEGDRLHITGRLEVFGCSCCPPNVTRYIATVADSVLSYDENGFYIHQFMPVKASVNGAEIKIDTEYPENGRIHIEIKNAAGKALYVRVPWWSKAEKGENGYKCYEITENVFSADIDFDASPKFFVCSPKVRANAGKAALLKGPVVYCMEGVDNKFDLFDFVADTAAEIKEGYNAELDCTVLTVKGTVSEKTDALYFPDGEEKRIPAKAVFIPYAAFANRGETDMAVWVRK